MIHSALWCYKAKIISRFILQQASVSYRKVEAHRKMSSLAIFFSRRFFLKLKSILLRHFYCPLERKKRFGQARLLCLNKDLQEKKVSRVYNNHTNKKSHQNGRWCLSPKNGKKVKNPYRCSKISLHKNFKLSLEQNVTEQTYPKISCRSQKCSVQS